MKRGFLIVAFCLANILPLNAQHTWEAIKANKSVYLCGEGWGETVQEADEQALADLISQISVVVQKSVSITEDEKQTNSSFDATSYVESKVKSYSEATLNNTERVVITNEPDAHVGRYVKRSEIDKIFESRRLKVAEYVRLALKAESLCKVDDALRDYYWAFSLLKTLPNPSEVKYNNDGEDHVLVTWIPEQMNNVFDDIRVRVCNIEENNIDLTFSFRGKPVTSLDYTYFDGRDWSNIYSAKDGRGVLEMLPGIDAKTAQLKYEYAYRGQTHIDREVENVLGVVKGKAMRKSYATINLEVEDEKPISKSEPAAPKSRNEKNNTEVVVQTDNNATTTNAIVSISASETAVVDKVVESVVASIKTKQFADVEDKFTAEGYDMFTKLINYGNARVLDYDKCTFTKFGDRVVARGLPMSFSFAKGVRKSFVEDVVFTLNADNKIECVAFALDEVALNDVMSKTSWSQEARQTIVTFLENYKTAYALKRIDYIESIFDDNAVIIIGHVVKKMERGEGDDADRFASNKYVKRTQLTKKQYITNLRSCFNSNEFVNIRFANNDIIKAGVGGEYYGIQIKQDYYSANYGDSGYLYLQVDMNDPDKPIIKVRTWQEEPDPEIGRPYGMEDF